MCVHARARACVCTCLRACVGMHTRASERQPALQWSCGPMRTWRGLAKPHDRSLPSWRLSPGRVRTHAMDPSASLAASHARCKAHSGTAVSVLLVHAASAGRLAGSAMLGSCPACMGLLGLCGNVNRSGTRGQPHNPSRAPRNRRHLRIHGAIAAAHNQPHTPAHAGRPALNNKTLSTRRPVVYYEAETRFFHRPSTSSASKHSSWPLLQPQQQRRCALPALPSLRLSCEELQGPSQPCVCVQPGGGGERESVPQEAGLWD